MQNRIIKDDVIILGDFSYEKKMNAEVVFMVIVRRLSIHAVSVQQIQVILKVIQISTNIYNLVILIQKNNIELMMND